MRIFSLCLLLIGVAQITMATPVIYQDGKMLDIIVDSKSTDSQLFYSLTSQVAVGYRYVQYSKDPSAMHLGQVNFLLKRWNEEDSQANIYLLGGLGAQDHSVEPYVGIETDWENRRIYLSALAETLGGNSSMTKWTLRAGFGSYLADYYDLNTWFIFQASHIESAQENDTWVIPMVRFFKDNILVELGSNGKIHSTTFRIHF
ncbi:MAG: hypothetical protein EXS67_02285 [Candidatus Margulisbacteria bacterium]|nr:hypothetical protein [Candidatus Margulisiibacteriota bacterium]